MDTASFLKQVVTTPEGWFSLLIGPPDGSGWHEEWYRWPIDLDAIAARADASAQRANVYFTAHLYSQQDSHKEYALASRTIQCDLDEAVVPTINPPTVLVETSPGRHQGYWILRDPMPTDILEPLSKQLTYSIADADRSGWSLGHKMRVPGTLNHKYASGPKQVKVISAAAQAYKELKLGGKHLLETEQGEDTFTPTELENMGPRELWATVKPTLPRKVQAQYDLRSQDRSAAMWALMLSLFRTGLDRNQVFWLAKESVNNKFADNKYHADLDLSKDVLRAERALRSGGDIEDIRTKVLDARRLPGLQAEKRAYIAALVRDAMAQQGSFVSTSDGQGWYIREDTGRPILITRNSDHLNSLLELRYGLNSSEGEHRYVVAAIMSSVTERGRPGIVSALSYYDKANEMLLLHTGRREVMQIDKQGTSVVANGNLGVVFPWRSNEDSFEPDLEEPVSLDVLFEGCFNNLLEATPAQALALAKAWLYFLFFRNDAVGRPILALFGQPGSGKSTLFRRIYTLLYGPGKAVNSVTNPDDFDYAVATDPVVVFDNVDTWAAWLPDKLALSASTSDLVKRKLYTDSDTITLKRQALVGITAHNPKFRREDIVDRLIMINLHRLQTFKPETEILNRILMQRDQIWGGIVNDLQKVLREPQPLEDEIPRFRISDFARIGVWVSRALGFETAFRDALQHNLADQTAFNLEEEDLLVDTIKQWLTLPAQTANPTRTWTSAELWTEWSLLARDPLNFSRMYRNAVQLGKKLWTLQETLGSVFKIEYELDTRGTRIWRIY